LPALGFGIELFNFFDIDIYYGTPCKMVLCRRHEERIELVIGEQLLAMARDEQLLPRGDLLDLWDLERQEEELRNRGEEAKDLDRLAGEGDADAAAAAKRARGEIGIVGRGADDRHAGRRRLERGRDAG